MRVFGCCCFSGEDKAKLIEENEKLKLSFKCKVCKRRNATVVVYPCKHRAMCENCVAPRERCNICSQPISSKIKYSDHPGSFN